VGWAACAADDGWCGVWTMLGRTGGDAGMVDDEGTERAGRCAKVGLCKRPLAVANPCKERGVGAGVQSADAVQGMKVAYGSRQQGNRVQLQRDGGADGVCSGAKHPRCLQRGGTARQAHSEYLKAEG
jgi:hypothetical protein